MSDKAAKVFKMMANAPIWEMMNSLGQGIADAQYAMDEYVIKAIQAMSKDENKIELGGQTKSLLELGLLPSFYHFSEVNLNMKFSISSMEGAGFTVGASVNIGPPIGMWGVGLSASYSNKYSFSANAASEVNAKIVSIPAPTELKQLISSSIAEKSNKDKK
ncbi:MAG: hypothetical protein KDD02_26230 [Phaeodactylibacter sp.]|nr:hypothetical protein [Phaeodactylibacter sp.]MCB9299223.1 hypothetical protein [Lewinellaceae bacterium]